MHVSDSFLQRGLQSLLEPGLLKGAEGREGRNGGRGGGVENRLGVT